MNRLEIKDKENCLAYASSVQSQQATEGLDLFHVPLTQTAVEVRPLVAVSLIEFRYLSPIQLSLLHLRANVILPNCEIIPLDAEVEPVNYYISQNDTPSENTNVKPKRHYENALLQSNAKYRFV